MISIIPALVLLLPLQGQAPDLSQKIAFESVAMPAKRLVAELGKQAGVKLDTSQQTAGETLVVCVNEMPLKDLLDRIAQAVDGEWKQEQGLMRLVRTAGSLNREIAAERADKIKTIQTEIKKQIDALSKKPEKPENANLPIAVPFGLGGDSKEILQLVSRLNPADLLLSDDDSRIVFSSSPTRTQRLLPGNLEPMVAAMVAEHNKAAIKAQEDKHEPQSDEEQKWMDLIKQFGWMQEPKPIEGRPAKLLMILESPSFVGGTMVTLRLYDAKGQVALEKSGNLGLGDFMADAMELGKPKPTPPADDKAIEFTPVTAELNGIFQGIGNMQLKTKFSPELEERLARPDLYDPLSFGTSESLIAVAKAKKINLVACIPDAMTSYIGLFTGTKPTVNTYLQSLEALDTLKIEKPEGWMLVTPKWPNQARTHRTDRLGLAKLIASAKANGSVSLDDLAAYAMTSPSPFEDSAAMPYLMLFAPSSMQGMGGLVDWNALKFYGSLGIAQRQSLMSKGQIPFGGLSPIQRDLANRMLYGPQSGLQIADPNAKPKDEKGFMDMVGTFMNSQHKDYRQEPTEIMPNGLPGNGYVTGEILRETVGQAVGAGPMFAHAAIGADELAMFKYFKEDPNMAMVAGMMPQINQLRLGERTNITMKFFVAQEVFAEKDLQDSRIPKDGPVVGVDNLPADLQAKIDKRLQALKKQPLPGFGVGTGGRIPPKSQYIP